MEKLHGVPIRVVISGVAAAGCLAGAVVASLAASAATVSKPTAAELAAAGDAGVTQHWERTAAGTIFPATISYSVSVGVEGGSSDDAATTENATRLGISPATSCAAAVDGTLASRTARDRCRAGLRATYTDALQGVIYTAGVLAFPSTMAAADFYDRLPSLPFPATGLHALPLAGTAAARFTDPAREELQAQQNGPYVVLVVAGYADGRAAAATGDRRDYEFGGAGQIASTLAAPLNVPVQVDCHDTAQWSC